MIVSRRRSYGCGLKQIARQREFKPTFTLWDNSYTSRDPWAKISEFEIVKSLSVCDHKTKKVLSYKTVLDKLTLSSNTLITQLRD